MRKVVPFLLFYVLTFCLARGQAMKFWHLNVKQGLSTNTVTCFLQDSQGFMWVGTQDGLNRYNGHTFEVYRYETKNPHSLTNNYINYLYEDSNGTIWVATSGGGILNYDAKLNRFNRINIKGGSKYIAYMHEDAQNNFWVAAGNSLYKKNRQKDEFVALPYFTSANIVAFLQMDTYQFLVATDGDGFFLLDIKTNQHKHFLHEEKNENSLCNNNITSIFKDIQEKIWIGTSQGLDRFDLQDFSFTHFRQGADKGKSLLTAPVRVIHGWSKDILFSSENGGLSKLDLSTMRFTHYLHDENNSESLSDNSVWAIHVDKQNRIWAGTFSSGISIADPYREKFSKPDIILRNKTVNAILKDSKNRLWVGTEGGLVVKDGDKTLYYEHDPKQKNSLPNNPVLAVYEDLQQRIWVGTWNGGLSLFDENTKSFFSYEVGYQSNKQLSNPNIFEIVQSAKNKQFFLASFGGMIVLESENPPIFKAYANDPSNPNSISGNYLMSIYEDKKGNLWVGSTGGLNHFDYATKKFTRYTHQEEDTNSISNSDIKCVLEDSKGRLWVGTAGGLNQMLPNGHFLKYTTQNGFPNNVINSILEDNQGNLWLSTNLGLCCFNPETKKCRNYDDSDGLQSNQFKADSRFKAKDGQLFFGGVEGFNAFYPDSIKDNPYLPKVLITGLKIFNKPVNIGDYDSLLKQHISQTKEVRLSHEHAVFSLDFVALNFTLSNKNQYAYKLEPFEKEWNEVGNQRSATYTNLNAGTYVFRVKASNNDGLWNEEGTSLKIIVLPPWWETWWFRTIVFLIIGASIITYNRLRIKALEKQKIKLEKLVAERTKALQQANEEIKTKNEELQSSEEELRQNMEELEANQEELKAQKEQLENAFAQLHKQNTKVQDSIRYAERIQQAILPHEDILASAFQEHFIIYKPKDVVSGDFYWYFEIQSEDKKNVKKFLAVVDCTGHGVPGAFMSMIGNTLLREVVESKHIHEPAHILNELNQRIMTSLNRRDKHFQDGMDIALCVMQYTEEDKINLKFAGAKRPLLYFKDSLQEIRLDHTSIGHKIDVQYKQQELLLEKDTVLYLTTDGWIDIINQERQRFGSQRFKEMLSQGAFLPFPTQHAFFLKELEDYQKDAEQRDDILFLAVKL